MAKHTLRSMIDGPMPLAGIQGAVEQKPPTKPKGKAQPPMDDEEDEQDPKLSKSVDDIEDEEAESKDKNVSPLAQHVAEHMQDPVGATRDGFSQLTQKRMEYNIARENMKRELAPVESIIQHVKQAHGLDENQNGIPDDLEQGYQEDPLHPTAGAPPMAPGMNRPGMAPPMGMKPGMPGTPGQPPMGVKPPMQPGMQRPGMAPNPAQDMARMSMPGAKLAAPPMQPGQPNPAQPSGQPPAAGKKPPFGKKPSTVKVHVSGGAAPGVRKAVGRTQMETGASLAHLASCNDSKKMFGKGKK